MSYNKLIKFDFCQLYFKILKKDKVFQLFNIEVLIKEISNQCLERKEIDVYEGFKVRIEKFDFDGENFLWRLRILRLRDNNLSFIVKPAEEAKPIELGDDEYLGEDMTMLFDVNNNVAMIQRNRFALGFNNLKKLFQKIMKDSAIKIDIRPVSKEVDIKKIQKDYFKSIELRFANIKVYDPDIVGGALGAIIRTYKILDGGGGSFTVNVGRTRKKSLAKESMRNFLDEISQNEDLFNAAILKAKDADDNDIDVINLFDNVYSVFISFELAERTSLSYKECVKKMTDKYIEHKDAILALL